MRRGNWNSSLVVVGRQTFFFLSGRGGGGDGAGYDKAGSIYAYTHIYIYFSSYTCIEAIVGTKVCQLCLQLLCAIYCVCVCVCVDVCARRVAESNSVRTLTHTYIYTHSHGEQHRSSFAIQQDFLVMIMVHPPTSIVCQSVRLSVFAGGKSHLGPIFVPALRQSGAFFSCSFDQWESGILGRAAKHIVAAAYAEFCHPSQH